MSPKLRAFLARASLLGGVAVVGSYLGRQAPHEQTIAIRLLGRDVAHVDGVVTRVGDAEPTAGFSREFPGASMVRHRFSAPNGTYIVVITLRESGRGADETGATGDKSPIPTETTFQRQVSLVGGEVIVSPD